MDTLFIIRGDSLFKGTGMLSTGYNLDKAKAAFMLIYLRYAKYTAGVYADPTLTTFEEVQERYGVTIQEVRVGVAYLGTNDKHTKEWTQ